MKDLFFLTILIFLFSCSKGGESGPGGIVPNTDSKIKSEYSHIRDINKRELENVLNSIPIIKERGSFRSKSTLEWKVGSITCGGIMDLKILFNNETKRYSIFRKVTKTAGNCKGTSQLDNYKTSRELNLGFLYTVIKSKDVKISEGTFEGKRAFMISHEEKEKFTNYLLSVEGDLLVSLHSETSYMGNDGYYKLRTEIYPTEGTKIDENLIEEKGPINGDILELSEGPLYVLIG